MRRSLVPVVTLLVLLLTGCDLVYQSVGNVFVRVENKNAYSLDNVAIAYRFNDVPHVITVGSVEAGTTTNLVPGDALDNVGGLWGNDSFDPAVDLSFQSRISDGAGGTVPVTATDVSLQDPAGFGWYEQFHAIREAVIIMHVTVSVAANGTLDPEVSMSYDLASFYE